MYGILKSIVNTGADSELAAVFATPLSIKSNSPEQGADTLSLRRVVTKSAAQRWEIEADLSQTDSSQELLFVNQIRFNPAVVYVRMPQLARKSAAVTGVPLVSSTTVKGATVIPTKSGTIPVGEFIKFQGHSKVYAVVESTANNITVYPGILAVVATNEIIHTGDQVTLSAMFDTDNLRGVSYADGILTDNGTVTLIEKL